MERAKRHRLSNVQRQTWMVMGFDTVNLSGRSMSQATRDYRVGSRLNQLYYDHRRTNTEHALRVRPDICSPSRCHYSGSHAKTSPLVLICSKLWAGGQNGSGGVNVQRQ